MIIAVPSMLVSKVFLSTSAIERKISVRLSAYHASSRSMSVILIVAMFPEPPITRMYTEVVV